jgi:hypothetical protein
MGHNAPRAVPRRLSWERGNDPRTWTDHDVAHIGSSAVVTSIAIVLEEHRALRRVARAGGSRRLTGVVLFDPYYVLYYVGFAFAPTSGRRVRPRHRRYTRSSSRASRSSTRAKALSDNDATTSNTGEPRAETAIERAVAALRSGRSCRPDGYPWILGYRGPTPRASGAGRPLRRELDADGRSIPWPKTC